MVLNSFWWEFTQSRNRSCSWHHSRKWGPPFRVRGGTQPMARGAVKRCLLCILQSLAEQGCPQTLAWTLCYLQWIKCKTEAYTWIVTGLLIYLYLGIIILCTHMCTRLSQSAYSWTFPGRVSSGSSQLTVSDVWWSLQRVNLMTTFLLETYITELYTVES